MSVKAKRELKVWLEVKVERIQKLLDKFGYIPCEFCLKPIASGSQIDAHHNNHNRRDNSSGNCRILDSYCNRIVIEDNNIKDVRSLL